MRLSSNPTDRSIVPMSRYPRHKLGDMREIIPEFVLAHHIYINVVAQNISSIGEFLFFLFDRGRAAS